MHGHIFFITFSYTLLHLYITRPNYLYNRYIGNIYLTNENKLDFCYSWSLLLAMRIFKTTFRLILRAGIERMKTDWYPHLFCSSPERGFLFVLLDNSGYLLLRRGTFPCLMLMSSFQLKQGLFIMKWVSGVYLSCRCCHLYCCPDFKLIPRGSHVPQPVVWFPVSVGIHNNVTRYTCVKTCADIQSVLCINEKWQKSALSE